MDTTIRISSAAVSDRGLSEKRPQNEDSFLEMGKSGIFAVADGVGGAQAGEVASQMAMEILGEAFANLADAADAEVAMRTAIERANAAIHQMAQELPQLANMATTIVALHLAENIATIGHVGDSRLYRVDRDGNLHKETADHSMVAEEVRAGRMTEEQAENHPNRNIISRALGAEPSVDSDIKTIAVEPGTSFLICSDGITRHVADDEIKGVLTFGGDPVDVCEYLKSLCYERGAEDNLTAVVVKVAGNAAVATANTLNFLSNINEDEPTVATVRSPFDVKADDDDLDLLELDTKELTMPPAVLETAPEPIIETVNETLPTLELDEPAEKEVIPEEVDDQAKTIQTDNFSMFGGSSEIEPDEEKSSSLVRIASTVGLILLGGLIGLGVYHLALVRNNATDAPPQLSEMRAANIPLSAFEENRRDVDKNPAGYLQKNPSPQDAEDYFLVGRAYLLTGDYAKARNAFVEARNRLGEADPTNANVLKNDIAMSIAVTNDTTIQNILKKEIEAAKPSANTNTNK